MTRTQDPPAKKSPPKAHKPKADKSTSTPPKATTSKKSRATKGGIGGDVRLTGDRLIVRMPGSGERTSAGGLLIPATAMPAPKRLAWGDVALVGPDVRVATRGDRVLFLPSSGLEVELDGEDLVLLRERDVQAVTTAGTKNERVPGQYL